LSVLIPIFLMRNRLREFASIVLPSVNNTAFIYLQQRMIEEAKQMLQIKTRRRGADSYEIANLALAWGLSGNTDQATKLFSMADWLANSNHLKAVIAYNRATIAASLGDYPLAKAKLREIIALSRRSVSKYFRLSSYFAEASKIDPEFELIVS
jgi:tetratricopeptide (TPR) repeat protein